MYSDHSGMKINNKRSFLILMKSIYKKPTSSNGETLNAFSLRTTFSTILEIIVSAVMLKKKKKKKLSDSRERSKTSGVFCACIRTYVENQ